MSALFYDPPPPPWMYDPTPPGQGTSPGFRTPGLPTVPAEVSRRGNPYNAQLPDLSQSVTLPSGDSGLLDNTKWYAPLVYGGVLNV